MRALAIDTVTEMCSVALWQDGMFIERKELAINRHSDIVLGMVSKLLAEAEITLTQVDLLVNDVGPGSFTGIRIGMGVTQGLAYGADLPVIGVDSLVTLALGVRELGSGDLLAAIDARMGQLYWAQFARSSDGLQCRGELHLSNPEQLGGITETVYGVGSGWDSYAPQLRERLSVSGVSEGHFPQARHALECGLARDESDWVSAGALLPVYLRNDVAKVSKKSPLASR